MQHGQAISLISENQDLTTQLVHVRKWWRRMEVQFTPEQEAQNSQIASYNGTPAEQLVKQATLRMVEEEAEIRAGIREGIAQADRGELVDHEDVKIRIFRRLQSQK